MGKRTPLYEEHLRLNGRIVTFGGWDMPVQYTGLADEHETCRTKVGLFDVSHMGEIVVKGQGALRFLNGLVTNDVGRIKDGQAQYTVMCYENGGCVDDLIIHRVNANEFFICVNASNIENDFDWIKSHAPTGVSVDNLSDQYSQIAIQGRFAQEILQKVSTAPLDNIKYYWFTDGEILGVRGYIARTGYTGENGFEVYIPSEDGPKLWRALLEIGSSYGIKPCGLGARDTLRTEMKFPLYGHEISQALNPLEAGLGWVVKFDKGDFVGSAALKELRTNGMKRSLVGLVTTGKGIPRQGYIVEAGGAPIGVVTSGTLSPSLKQGIAICYVDNAFQKIGTEVDVVIRDQRIKHRVVETPFYKRNY